jgi:hypothetical protein
MAERSFYLIVRGAGSWSGGNPFRTYKAGIHEVDAAVAETVLAFKKQAPKASWLILSDVRPELEHDSLVGLLLPEDLPPGVTPQGIRLLHPAEQAENSPRNPNDRAEAPPPVYACQLCPACFPSAAAAKRHLRHNHLLQPAKAEARARAQLATQRE